MAGRIREIADSDLTLADIPSPEADWGTIGRFALTYNGYEKCGSLEACAEIANSGRIETLADLRACLFFEQRRWRHFGRAPDGAAMSHIRSLLAQTRDRVAARTADSA